MLQIPEGTLTKNQIWRFSLDLYKAKFWQVYGIVFVIVIVQHLFFPKVFGFSSHNLFYRLLRIDGSGSYTGLGILAPHTPHVLLFLLITSLIDLLVTIFIYHQLGTLLAKTPVNMNESFMAALKRFPKVFLTMLFCSIVIFLGFIFLIVPGIYLSLALTPCFAYVILEKRGIVESFVLSLKITWSHWWRLAALTVMPVLIMSLVFMSIMLLTFMLKFFLGSSMYIDWVVSLLLVLVNSLIVPYLISLKIVTWHDLKIRYQEKLSKV